jgi:site-specific DNA-methyltransferase (adenine-specific)
MFQKYFKLKNILIWVKNNTSMGDLYGSYAPKYEMILFGVKGKRKLIDGRDPDILTFKRTNNVFHPTQKPVDLLEYFIKKSSVKNDIILDPFMGSGSTGVACANTKRCFIGIEKDEQYFLTAKDRLREVIS